MKRFCILAFVFVTACSIRGFADAASDALAKEIHDKGWIAYSARADNGTWDLFMSRPDGTDRRNLTNTPDIEEAAPRFSPNADRLLFRQLAKGTKINHDLWGFQGHLVIAKPDASQPEPFGKDDEFPWASWSPDGKSIVCLTKKGVQVVSVAARTIDHEFSREGIYQQLFWSPDGQWFCGTGNHQGQSWNVVRMNATTHAVNPVHIYQSCTPDWFPDSKRIIYSSRPGGQKANDGYGWTQLCMANGDGSDAKLLYGEEGRHIYGGAVSPDSQYVLFTRCPQDGGGSESAGAPICVMRLSDAPIIRGESAELRALHPEAKDGAVLELAPGWEPCWTAADVGAKG